MTTIADLDALIDELTVDVDVYNDDEQLVGFLVGAEAALRSGEAARIVGAEVEINSIDRGKTPAPA